MAVPAGRTVAQVAGVLVLVAVGLAVLGIVLLGLPGAAWLSLASPIAGLFTRMRAPADSMWPMAILHSLLWPAFLPLAYWLVARRTGPGRARVGWTLGLTAAGALALAVVFELRSGLVS